MIDMENKILKYLKPSTRSPTLYVENAMNSMEVYKVNLPNLSTKKIPLNF